MAAPTERSIGAAVAPAHRSALTFAAQHGSTGVSVPAIDISLLDPESRSWWDRLHGCASIRTEAIEELHERLQREARFHVRQRVSALSAFPRSDIDDLATQAADDALIALLRKLDDYRGESQFLTWARRFAALDARVSVRRRLGRDRVGISRDPDHALLVADPDYSLHDRVEMRERLRSLTKVINNRLTVRQRAVLVAVAIDGVSTDTLAGELRTTPGAIYKTLHDARVKLRRHAA
jgi:RNA polymerase sigma-70 factor, ECF subfamily